MEKPNCLHIRISRDIFVVGISEKNLDLATCYALLCLLYLLFTGVSLL